MQDKVQEILNQAKLEIAAQTKEQDLLNATAFDDAVAYGGWSMDCHVIEGFLSTAKNERRARLEEIRNEMRTMIFYEAPHKLIGTLEDLYATFGKRRLTLCRELTKKNEEIIYTTTEGAIELYREKQPRGEYVLVLEGLFEASGGRAAPKNEENDALLTLSPQEHVAHYENQGLSRMDAIKKAAKDRSMSKSDFYRLVCAEAKE